MSIFTKKTSLAERRTSRDALVTKLEAATTALDLARIEAVSLAVSGADDTQQATANDKIHKSEIQLSVLQNALAETETEIARLEHEERQKADKADKAEREATAKSLNKMAEVYEKSVVSFPGVIQGILAAYENAKAVTGETGMPVILTNMGQEISSAVATIVAESRARAVQTLAGSAPPSLPVPFVPEVVKAPKEEPTTQIFSLQHMSWLNEEGTRQSCAPYQITHLPTAAAKTAIQRKLAIEPDSERAKAMRLDINQRPMLDANRTYDLSADPNAPLSVDVHGRTKPFFEPYVRGPARQVFLPKEPDLEVAQR